ncbi:Gfo/Idh/MocA family protein [Haliangium sp.]|uniref:Gfo/Idh/MocA family protein n=1 Tax=Haliangium sp. TaxID=2663208 RepID=UPI003D09BA83
MTDMSGPRVGVIGTNWGRMHIGGFRAAGALVAGICGRDRDKTAGIARDEDIALATTRVEELCAAVDIAVVSGPDGLHREHIEAALTAGCHVLSEKPITRTADDARALAALAQGFEARGRVCAVSFPYRMSPPVVALDEWLGAPGRGPGEWLTVTLRSSFAAAEGRAQEGPLMGVSGDFGGASHVLDAAFWLMRGRPAWVEAVMMGRPAHSLCLHIGLDTGAMVSVNHLASHDPGIVGEWHLIGAGWEARFTGEYRPWAHGWRIGPSEGFSGQGWDQIGAAVAPGPDGEPWALAHRDTARAVLAAVAGDGGGSRADVGRLARFRHGADVQATFEAAMRSEAERTRVAVELA